MKTTRLTHFALMLVAASLLLSACSSDDDKKDKQTVYEDKKALEEKYKNKIDVPDPICPQTAIVRGMDDVRDYGAENPDPAQLVAAAKLAGITGECEYTDDGIDIAFHANMTARRGPRLGGLHVSFPYFVAVVDPTGNIMNKNIITAEISFASDDPLANHEEDLHVLIPISKDKKQLGPYYKVLTGFQLTPDQAKAAQSQ